MFPFRKKEKKDAQPDLDTIKATENVNTSEVIEENDSILNSEPCEANGSGDDGDVSENPCEPFDTETAEIESSPSEDSQNIEGAFVIKTKTEGSTPLLESIEYEKLLELHPFLSEVAPKKFTQSTLVIMPESADTITDHISWGKNTSDNMYEQGGIIIGRVYRISKDVIVGIAEAAIPAETNSANPAYLKMDTDAWSKMLDTYDERYKCNGLLVVGWYHTHPNSLSVFMSSTDQATQRAFFNQDWHFAVVLNPQKRKAGCFVSADSTLCSYLPKKFVV